MDSQTAVRYVGAGLLTIVVASILAYALAPSSTQTPSVEVSLAMITGGALVIERVLEGCWAFVDLTAGGWWPANVVSRKIDERVDNFGNFAKPYFGAMRAVVNPLAAAAEELEPKLQEALRRIDDAESAVLHHVPPAASRDQKLNSLVTEAAAQIRGVLAAHPDVATNLKTDVDLGRQLIRDAKGFLDDFGDNPGRQILSLYVGVLLGLLIASVVGLDIFSASLGTQDFDRLAVPATGIAMGLGSNPTHEVIKAIQKFKGIKSV